MKISLFLFFILTLTVFAERTLKEVAKVHASAIGWNLKVGKGKSTIIVNKDGVEANVGHTMYPDWVFSRLFMVQNNTKSYLVIYTPPMASGATAMFIYEIQKGKPILFKIIEHHYEFGVTKDKKATVTVPDYKIELVRLIFPSPNDELANLIKATFER